MALYQANRKGLPNYCIASLGLPQLLSCPIACAILFTFWVVVHDTSICIFVFAHAKFQSFPVSANIYIFKTESVVVAWYDFDWMKPLLFWQSLDSLREKSCTICARCAQQGANTKKRPMCCRGIQSRDVNA